VIEEGGGGHKYHGHKVDANTEPHVRGEMVLQYEGLSEKGRGQDRGRERQRKGMRCRKRGSKYVFGFSRSCQLSQLSSHLSAPFLLLPSSPSSFLQHPNLEKGCDDDDRASYELIDGYGNIE